MDLKAKMANGAITLGAGGQIVNAVADLFDAYTNANMPILASWSVDTWQVVLGVLIGALAGGPFLVGSEIVRQLSVRLFSKLGVDLSKVVGTTSVLLFVLVLGACSSVPTSSEGTTSADGSTGKGGTIACGEGWTPGSAAADGSVIPGACAKDFVWTDPPAPEETTMIGAVVEGVMKPFEILATALARLIPGGSE